MSNCKINHPMLAASLPTIVSNTIFSPFRVLSIRVRNQPNNENTKPLGSFSIFSKIINQEGYKGLWKGNSVYIAKAIVSEASSVVIRRFLLRFIASDPNLNQHWKGYLLSLLPGMASNLGSVMLTYSLEYAYTRVVNDEGKEFKGAGDVIKLTYNKEGFRGLYKGALMATLGTCSYHLIFFGIHKLATRVSGERMNSHSFGFLVVMGVTFLTSLCVYPLDTVMRRMIMDSAEKKEYEGTLDCTKKIVKNEGVKSFFRGALLATIAGVGTLVVATAITRLWR